MPPPPNHSVRWRAVNETTTDLFPPPAHHSVRWRAADEATTDLCPPSPPSVLGRAVYERDLVHRLVGRRRLRHQLRLLSALAAPLQPLWLHLLVQTALQSLQVNLLRTRLTLLRSVV